MRLAGVRPFGRRVGHAGEAGAPIGLAVAMPSPGEDPEGIEESDAAAIAEAAGFRPGDDSIALWLRD